MATRAQLFRYAAERSGKKAAVKRLRARVAEKRRLAAKEGHTLLHVTPASASSPKLRAVNATARRRSSVHP